MQTATGLLNTGIGANSGLSLTGGSYNSWLGTDAFKNNKNGLYNRALGAQASMEDTVGSFNLYIGAFAGKSTQGGSNVFIGPFSGNGDIKNLGNKFILNNNNSTTHLIDGDFYYHRTGINKSFADLNYTLDIGGEIRIGSLSTNPPGANEVLYYNNVDNKLKTYENGNWKNAVYDNIIKTKSTDPDISDVPNNTFHVWKNTLNGNVYLWVNDGGILKKVLLQ